MAILIQQKNNVYKGSWSDIITQIQKDNKINEEFPCVYLWTLQVKE